MPVGIIVFVLSNTNSQIVANSWINAIAFIYIMFIPVNLSKILTGQEGF